VARGERRRTPGRVGQAVGQLERAVGLDPPQGLGVAVAVVGDEVGPGVDPRGDDQLDDRATLVDQVRAGDNAVDPLLDDRVALVAELARRGGLVGGFIRSACASSCY
jgi:ABC-type transporter Mla subunit MlaD